MRTPTRPGQKTDGSIVNVIPASSGVSSSSLMNGYSWTSRPMQWPVRWRNQSP